MGANPDDKVFAQDLAKQAAKKKLEDEQKATEAAKAAEAAKASAAAIAARQQAYQNLAQNQAAAAPKVVAHHRVTGDETLSHLSLKYYGHTTEPYWRLIYEFNKEKIGPNYKNIYDGLVLDIPELPASMK
jgi:nucleoid-associated protein YgaU